VWGIKGKVRSEGENRGRGEVVVMARGALVGYRRKKNLTRA